MLIAALGVLTNLLAVGAAFGIGRLIFQNGHGAGLLGFESQSFLDAWAPVFFFEATTRKRQQWADSPTAGA